MGRDIMGRVAIALMLAASCAAAITAEPVGAPKRLELMLPALCPGMVNDLVARQPRIGIALAGQQLDSAATCACANERFLRDREISRVASRPLAEVLKETGSAANVQLAAAYISTRGVQHTMACLAEELDRKLAGTVIPVSPVASPDVQLREFGDTIVPLVIGNDLTALYAQFAPSRRPALSFEQLTREAATMRELFGVIRTTSYRGIEQGVRTTDGRQERFVQISYDVTTERYTADHRLVIQVLLEEGRLWVARLGIQRNLGQLPPPAAPVTGS
jgi:hypothetical protein